LGWVVGLCKWDNQGAVASMAPARAARARTAIRRALMVRG
jgi:hypothetical protein